MCIHRGILKLRQDFSKKCRGYGLPKDNELSKRIFRTPLVSSSKIVEHT